MNSNGSNTQVFEAIANPSFGTNMCIDVSHVPEYRLRLNPANDFREVSENFVQSIPRTWTPKYHRYIDGVRYFEVRRRDNGYLVAAFDRNRVRSFIQRSPVIWERECIRSNQIADEWEGAESNNSKFWIFYLPFLNLPDNRHERLDFGDHILYTLTRDGIVEFECDMREVVDLWRNVRTDQWSILAQHKVAEFLRRATTVGWNNPPPQPPQPPQSPDHSRPASPTDEDMDQYVDYSGGDVQPQPQADDNSDGDSDVSSTATAVANPFDNDANDDDTSSDDGGFSDDVNSILENEGSIDIVYPGQQQRNNNNSNRDNRPTSPEWRPESPTGWDTAAIPNNNNDHREYRYFDIPRFSPSTPPPSDTRYTDRLTRPWDDYNSDSSNSDTESEIEWIQSGPAAESANGSINEPEPSDHSVREFWLRGHRYQYTALNGKYWFTCCGKAEDNERHQRQWESGELHIPNTSTAIRTSQDEAYNDDDGEDYEPYSVPDYHHDYPRYDEVYEEPEYGNGIWD